MTPLVKANTVSSLSIILEMSDSFAELILSLNYSTLSLKNQDAPGEGA